MGGDSGQRGTRREKITVPLSHPLILLRAQAPPAGCIPAYAMGHTMRLDKIMIWISIHLHSLPRGTSLRRDSRVSSFAIPRFAELRSLSYECSARVPTALVSSKCDTDGRGLPPGTRSARRGATAALGRKKGRYRGLQRSDRARLMSRACIRFFSLFFPLQPQTHRASLC